MIELLLTLLAAITGIDRAPDADLAALAQERSASIVCASDDFFTHAGKPDNVVEILTCFPDSGDLVQQAANAWRNSPVHWAVLSNPAYTRIGCGATSSNGGILFACELSRDAPAAAKVPNTAAPGVTSAAGFVLVIASGIGFQIVARRNRQDRKARL